MRLLLAAMCFMSSVTAFARVEVLPPLQVETEVGAWTRTYSRTVRQMHASNTYPAEGYMECREVKEVVDTFLCQSEDTDEMNTAFARASFFVEGLGDPSNKGKVKNLQDPVYRQYKQMIGGHDLKGSDLLRFRNQAEVDCASSKNDVNICFNSGEGDLFNNFIVPQASRMSDLVVISFANQGIASWEEIVTHEVMHAQYFNQAPYRAVVDSFWANEMSESERAEIRSELGQFYDATDELLMKNEFQAYILMSGAEMSQLARYVSLYRDRLLKRLTDQGLTPIQVK